MAVPVVCDRQDGFRIGGCALVMVLFVASCSDGDTASDDGSGGLDTASVVSIGPVDVAADGTLPLAEQALDDPDVTSVATELAPSQVAASTVPVPSTPPLCAPDDVELWTARVDGGGPTVDAVIRVRNVGEEWCEADIGRSPLLDPAIEPDVWLRPGEAGDLRVGQMSTGCAEPSLVTLIQVGIDTGSIVVPSSVITCGWWLDAFAPIDPATEVCAPDGLEVAVTDVAVVVRTAMGPCRLGDIVTAERDDGVDVLAERSAGPTAFDVLYPGDVGLIGVATGSACDGPVGRVTLGLEAAADIVVDEVPCDVRFRSGPAAPWFGSDFGPTSDISAESLDLERVLDALDPFAPPE